MKRVQSKYMLSLLLVIGGIAAAGAYILARRVSARDEPTVAEAFIARRLRHFAIPRGAREAKNPLEPSLEVLDNKPVVIMLEKGTKYLINEKPAKKADLKVGVRVVIDAHMDTKMKMYSAEEVNIGAAK